MFTRTRGTGALLVLAPLTLIWAAEQPWNDKPISQWTPEDAKQVLTDSPWARSASLSLSTQQSRPANRGMGRRGGYGGGMGYPGGGIGFPGGGRRGGMGYPGGGYPGGGGGGYPGGNGGGNSQDRYPADDSGSSRDAGSREPQTVIVRWESAQPVQDALLKSKDTKSAEIDSSHYAIVVAGLPASMARRNLAEKDLKSGAELKKDGKKFTTPSSVRVLSHDDETLIVYLFPRSKEIKPGDKQVAFSAHFGRYEVYQTYYLDDMVYHGKREL